MQHSPITRDNVHDVIAAREAAETAQLEQLYKDLGDLIEARKMAASPMVSNLLWAQFNFTKSLDAWAKGVPSDDLFEEVCSNLRVDEEGNPLNEHGCPVRQFNPSRVHPDDHCQSKGLVA